MQKYECILREINVEIEKFNTLLAEGLRIAPLNVSNPESCLVIAGVPFEEQAWPYSGSPGVYICCAHDQNDPTRLGAYIGKSSRAIGFRVWHHLNPHRATKIYQMKDRSGQIFIIEAIVCVGLLEPRMKTFASALEEFIIAGVKGRVHLLNRSGNL